MPVLTIGDYSVIGGFGSAVLESAQAQHVNTSNIHRPGIPDRWIMQDSRNKQLATQASTPQASPKPSAWQSNNTPIPQTQTLKVQTATTQTAHA